ncbi:MAG TPA: hypothetical protein VGG03_18690 [Thermoanaerobaculia bacterium]|jgi:hypothetical protein
MKKRNLKKLSLSRETVRHLGSSDLKRAAGGTTAGSEYCTSTLCFQETQCECNTFGDCYPPSACFASCSCSFREATCSC